MAISNKCFPRYIVTITLILKFFYLNTLSFASFKYYIIVKKTGTNITHRLIITQV